MPTLPLKSCPHPGCPELTSGGMCSTHTKRYKQDSRGISKTWQSLYNYRWEKYSKARLRKHPLCVQCLKDGKTTAAQVTDHIIPHKGLRHLFWDKTNHQSLCKRCHDIKTYKEGAFVKRKAMGEIILVCGPPGSGKTTYVMNNKMVIDVIVDFDMIYKAISGHDLYQKPKDFYPVVAEAMKNIINTSVDNGLTVWIITTGNTKAKRAAALLKHKADRVIILETSTQECLKRIQNDKTRPDRSEATKPIIESWWNTYEIEPDAIIVR